MACLYSPRKQMGRPRKRRREEETQGSAYDPWGFDTNGASAITATTQPGGSIVFPTALDPQFTANGFTGQNGIGTDPMNLSDGPTMASMGYDDISQQVFAPNSMPDTDLTYESLQGFPTPNSFSDYAGWMSIPDPVLPPTTISCGQTQLHTPPTTLYHNSSSPETRSPDSNRCDCLQTLYKTLSSFPPTSSPTFPYSMKFLKEATAIGRSMLKCENCPNAYSTAVQNGTGLGTLLSLVVMEYTKLLKHIDERAEKEDKILFRMGEIPTPSTQHLHSRALSCPMGINVDLSGAEWRIIARTAVRKEIFGDDTGNENLSRIMDDMRERQVRWHNTFPRENHTHDQAAAPGSEREQGLSDCICTQLLYIDRLKRSLKGLGL